MRVHHIFYAVGDDVAGRKGIQHPVVPHGNAVIDCNRIEFGREAAQFLNLGLDDLARLVEVGVAGNELGEGIGDGDHGLAELLPLHPVRHPKRTGPCHPAAFKSNTTTIIHN